MLLAEADVSEDWDSKTDWRELAQRAVTAAFAVTDHAHLTAGGPPIEISVRFTSDEEVRTLSRDYRGKDKPTNVLSFPMAEPALLAAAADGDDIEILLGDLVLAHGVCAREAQERGIPMATHASHLLVHGTLHLLGQDHETSDADADAMEDAERRALATLGISDPYSLPQLQD